MLDIKFIRNNPDKVKDACEKKGINVDIDLLLETDKKRRETLQALEDMLAQKNKANKEIQQANPEEKNKIILEMRELDQNSDRLNQDSQKLEKEFNDLMLRIPNIPFSDVPLGQDERDNIVLREVGKKPKFDFQFKDYMEIAENLDLIDTKRAAKISGPRFGYLKREAALLEFALINFAPGIFSLIK